MPSISYDVSREGIFGRLSDTLWELAQNYDHASRGTILLCPDSGPPHLDRYGRGWGRFGDAGKPLCTRWVLVAEMPIERQPAPVSRPTAPRSERGTADGAAGQSAPMSFLSPSAWLWENRYRPGVTTVCRITLTLHEDGNHRLEFVHDYDGAAEGDDKQLAALLRVTKDIIGELGGRGFWVTKTARRRRRASEISRDQANEYHARLMQDPDLSAEDLAKQLDLSDSSVLRNAFKKYGLKYP